MSQTIWTQCGASDLLESIHCSCWRVVEDQGTASTLRLVESESDQALLESEIERAAKPPLPRLIEHCKLKWLVRSPFRYRRPTRFTSEYDAGVWYGSIEIETALAEIAFHLLRFYDASRLTRPTTSRRVAIRVEVSASRGLDLRRSEFDVVRHQLESPTRYSDCRSLCVDIIDRGVQAFYFASCRTIDPGTNICVIDPTAITSPVPIDQHWWLVHVKPDRVICQRTLSLGGEVGLEFQREQFLVDGEMPSPV